MNEKRFEVLFYGDVINCVRDETGKEYNLHELISILMEQQATISALTKENKELGKNFEDLVEWVSGIAKRNVVLDEQIGQLQRENEQLKEQLQEKQEEERLYANEILELRETNKEHIKFKSLGGNY